MTVFLGNKYQSKQRDNLRKIAGISENNDKIEVENKKRILGKTGTAWVTGNSAASETTGNPDTNDCCNKEPKKPDPNPEPNPNPNPNPDPDDPYLCECVSVGHSNATAYCCVSGKDCESGRTIRVQRRGGNTKADCDDYRPIPFGDCIYRVYSSASIDDIEDIYSGLDGLQGALEQQLQATIEHQEEKLKCTPTSCSKCESVTWEVVYERTYTITCGEQSVEITTKTMSGTNKCVTLGAGSGFSKISRKSEYDKYLAWHEKNKARLLYASGGKLYNACDPYGEPPIECVEMCDENGNKYRVCGNGSITPL